MFNRLKREPNPVDQAIADLVSEMESMNGDTPEYAAMAKNLTELHKAKSQLKDRRISPDTLLIVGGNLVGILLILNFERAGVVASKALSFVMKTKT